MVRAEAPAGAPPTLGSRKAATYRFGEPGEAVERLHEGAVAQAGSFEVGQLVLGKEAAEGGQRNGGLAMREGAEDDLHPLVAVMVLVPGRSASRTHQAGG